MASDIETYLRELQAALTAAGADPALVQDALFDAEEYLQAEMAVGGTVGRGTATYEARFATVSEGYGTPREVAAAYLGTTAPAQEVAAWVEAAAAAEAAPMATFGFEAAPVNEPKPEVESEATGPGALFCPKCGQRLHRNARFCVSCGAVAGAPPAGAPVPTGVATGMAASAAGTGAPPSVLRQIFGVFAEPAVWKALVYMLISLGTGTVYFTVVVTGVALSVPMLILIIGIPLMFMVLGLFRALSLFEGRLVEWLLGTRMPRRLRSDPPDAGFFQRMWFWVKDGRTWASMVYMMLMLPLGIAYFAVAVAGLTIGVGLVGSPFWYWAAWADTQTFVHEGITYEWQFPAWGIPLAMIVGVLLLIGMFHLIKWLGRGHAAFAKAMLVRLP